MEDNETMMVQEPAGAALSENVSRSGLLGLVKGLSHPDKVALISYLKKDVGQEDPFRTDEFGRIILTKKMRDAVHLAERDLEEGRCYTESEFKTRFSKWL